MSALIRLLGFLKPYRGRFLLACGLMLLVTAADLVVPMLFGWTVDRGLGSGDINQVLLYAGLLVVGQLLKSALLYLQWLIQQRVGQNVVRDVRDAVYGRLQALPPRFFRDMPTGQIMSRVTSDVEAVQEYVGWGFLLQLASAVSFVATSVVLFWLDWRVTAAAMAPLVILVIVVSRFGRRIGPAWEREREQMGRLTTVVQENLSGIRVVKAFTRESMSAALFRDNNDLNRQRNLDRAELEARAFPTMDLMTGLAFAILALVGARRVAAGELSLGVFFAYQWYLWGIIWPTRILGWLVSMMRQAMAGAPRLFEILDAPLHIADRPGARALTHVAGEIHFDKVSFAFPDAPDRPVLDELDLHVRPGEVVAVLGGTGSGKTTLANLLLRFHDVTGGRLCVDGHDVRDVRIADLRGHIGIVPQESFLFSATVRENIAYGHPDADVAAVEQAARLAQAHEFIMAMEKGYETQIGERGVRLSGGQKQRLALARAILVDPAILILDEAMSAVDTETEHAIQQALAGVMAGRTSLVIAQRLSTIKHADRIVVLKDGRVAEAGTHAELLARGGEYARIYELQYRERDELAEEMQRYLRAHGRTPAAVTDLTQWPLAG